MSRPLRIFSHSKIYHIIFKGIDNQNIFYDNQDRNFFLEQLLNTKKKFNYKIYAYCLMDNHVHMVIQVENKFLSKSIQSLCIRYAYYFNKKYQRVGSFIQNRFKSKNIESQNYFLKVCRYVHRNPENAGISKTENYNWSSYKEYLDNAFLIDKNALLYYFNNNIHEFIKYTTKFNDFEDAADFAEYELIQKLSDENLSTIIMKKFRIQSINDISIFFQKKSKQDKEFCIKELKKIKGTNITQVSRILRINRKIVERIWKQNKKIG